MTTHLDIEEYFFPQVLVSADPTCDDYGDANDIKYKVDVSLAKNEEEEKYQLVVDISSYPEEGESQPYTINIVAVGIFEVIDWPEPEKLLLINGASVLYSSAREFLITITSRGPFGALKLPVYSFLDHFKKIAEEKKTSNDD